MCSDTNLHAEAEDDFWFETENIALKGNKDYSKLLRTLCILESQRHQAIKVCSYCQDLMGS